MKYCLHWGYSKMCYRFLKYSKEKISKSFWAKLEYMDASPEDCFNKAWPSTEASTSATTPFDLDQVLTLGFSSGRMKDPSYLCHRIVMWSKWITSANMLCNACLWQYYEKWKSLSFFRQDSGNLSIYQGKDLEEVISLARSTFFSYIMTDSSSWWMCLRFCQVSLPVYLLLRGKPLPDKWLQGLEKYIHFQTCCFLRKALWWLLRTNCVRRHWSSHDRNLSHTGSRRACTKTTHLCKGVLTFKKEAKCPLPHGNHWREAQKENSSSKPNL